MPSVYFDQGNDLRKEKRDYGKTGYGANHHTYRMS